MACSIITGPMFSGKSTRLVTELTTFADIGMSCLYLNSCLDDRLVENSDADVSTHSSQFRGLSSKIRGCKVSKLSSVNVEPYAVIGIDEAQFFPDLKKEVTTWVNKLGKRVIVAGLDGDFRMQRFGQLLSLVPISDSIVKLNAYCMKCLEQGEQRDAPFSARISSDSDSQIEVGGKDKYVAVCRKCFLE